MSQSCLAASFIAAFVLCKAQLLSAAPPVAATSTADATSIGLELQDIIDGVHARNQRMPTLSVHVTCSLFDRSRKDGSLSELKPFKDFPVEVKRKGTMFRLQKELPDHGVLDSNIVYDAAWNGRSLTTMQSHLTRPIQDRYHGLISARPGTALFHSMGYPTTLEEVVFDFDEPLGTLLNRGKWRIVGTEVVGDYHAYHIAGEGLNPRNTILDAWIAPARDFATVQMKVTDNVNGKVLTQTLHDITLVQCDGVWLPSKAEVLKDNPSANPDYVYTEEERFTDFHVGMPLADAEFTIEFPKYTNLFDDTTKKSSIVGVGEHVMGNDGLVSLVAPDGHVIESMKPAAARRRWPWVAPIVAFAALAVFFAIFAKLRKARPSPAKT